MRACGVLHCNRPVAYIAHEVLRVCLCAMWLFLLRTACALAAVRAMRAHVVWFLFLAATSDAPVTSYAIRVVLQGAKRCFEHPNDVVLRYALVNLRYLNCLHWSAIPGSDIYHPRWQRRSKGEGRIAIGRGRPGRSFAAGRGPRPVTMTRYCRSYVKV